MSTIRIKRGQSSNLASLELKAGEPAFTLDTKKLYIGTGTEITLINPDIGEIVTDGEKEYWNNKAESVSPEFTGTPTAPTPASDDNSTRLATTAYVKSLGYVPANGAIDGGTF